MTEAEALYEGVHNSTQENNLGMLKVLGSSGAVSAFAMLQKNYPDVLTVVQAFEQKKFLEDHNPTPGEFAAFKSGQGSVTKYAAQSLKYTLSIDDQAKS